MTTFNVVLAMYDHHGECVGSTDDDVEADSPQEAERALIEEWKRVRPDCTVRPLLLTIAR